MRVRFPIHSSRPPGRHRLRDTILATVGYILSPLSWWNDLFVNVPLAYGFAFPFGLLDPRLFLPAFILGYWLSNLLGLLLLHRGVAGIVGKPPPTGMGMRGSLFVALLYTLVIALLVWLHWIPGPDALTRYLKAH